MSVTGVAERLSVDGVWIESETEVTAYTLVRGQGARTLPLALVRAAVGELVARVRGPEWCVSVREVAVLRLFDQSADSDMVETHVTCEAAGGGDIVASGRCARGGTLVATVMARLAVWRAER